MKIPTIHLSQAETQLIERAADLTRLTASEWIHQTIVAEANKQTSRSSFAAGHPGEHHGIYKSVR